MRGASWLGDQKAKDVVIESTPRLAMEEMLRRDKGEGPRVKAMCPALKSGTNTFRESVKNTRIESYARGSDMLLFSILKKGSERLPDTVFQNVIRATVLTASQSQWSESCRTPEEMHRELMHLFVATVGRPYLTTKEIRRASDEFWKWVPKLFTGSIF